jgi:hypothetical protein
MTTNKIKILYENKAISEWNTYKKVNWLTRSQW